MSLATSLLAICVLCIFNPTLSEERKRYDDYKVLSIFPKTLEAVHLLRSLMFNDVEHQIWPTSHYNISASATDFWQEPTYVGKEVQLMISPSHRPEVEQMLRNAGVDFTYHTENVQDLLNPMWEEIDRRQMDPEKRVFNLEDFNTLDDINGWLTTLVGNCRAGLTCELYSIGTSYEGRELWAFKISKPGADRKAYWLDATVHAREWIATATILKVLNHLATGGDENAIRLTEQYDWYIMPVLNPDGYIQTWNGDRLWRKNRRPNSGSVCIGTDLNRNFDILWGNEGVSNSPCSDTFCGPSAGSEPETQAMQAEMTRLGPSLAALLSVHAYGNMWMFPWGNSINYAGQVCNLAEDHDELMAIANPAADAVQATYGTSWARGNLCVVIYATTGSSVDYAKAQSGIKNAFALELRGNSFIIAASNITPSFNEFWNGLVAMSDAINA